MSDYTVLTQNDNGQKKYLVRKTGYVGGGSSGTMIDAYTKTETDNLLSGKQDKGDYALKSEIPTKTSSLTNDSGFLTEHQDISGKQDKLVAGDNITIEGNVISSTGGGGSSGSIDVSDAFPSSRYIELTLGNSGDTYIAPANGWFQLVKKSGKSDCYIFLFNETNKLHHQICSPKDSLSLRMSLPVKNGDAIQVSYSATGETLFFGFIYAEGDADA